MRSGSEGEGERGRWINVVRGVRERGVERGCEQ